METSCQKKQVLVDEKKMVLFPLLYHIGTFPANNMCISPTFTATSLAVSSTRFVFKKTLGFQQAL
jgi:hypothetical protein